MRARLGTRRLNSAQFSYSLEATQGSSIKSKSARQRHHGPRNTFELQEASVNPRFPFPLAILARARRRSPSTGSKEPTLPVRTTQSGVLTATAVQGLAKCPEGERARPHAELALSRPSSATEQPISKGPHATLAYHPTSPYNMGFSSPRSGPERSEGPSGSVAIPRWRAPDVNAELEWSGCREATPRPPPSPSPTSAQSPAPTPSRRCRSLRRPSADDV